MQYNFYWPALSWLHTQSLYDSIFLCPCFWQHHIPQWRDHCWISAISCAPSRISFHDLWLNRIPATATNIRNRFFFHFLQQKRWWFTVEPHACSSSNPTLQTCPVLLIRFSRPSDIQLTVKIDFSRKNRSVKVWIFIGTGVKKKKRKRGNVHSREVSVGWPTPSQLDRGASTVMRLPRRGHST